MGDFYDPTRFLGECRIGGGHRQRARCREHTQFSFHFLCLLFDARALRARRRILAGPFVGLLSKTAVSLD
jgi:hypothetical protein